MSHKQLLFCQFFCLLCAFSNIAQAQSSQDKSRGLSLSAAISSALSENSNILLARSQEDLARGAVQNARGIFDLTINAQGGLTSTKDPLTLSTRNTYLANGFDLNYNLSEVATTQAGATQLFSNGLQTSLVATHTNTISNLYPIAGTPNQSTGLLIFQLRLPILRNSGDYVSAQLRSAELEAEAARGDLEFTASNIVLNTALAYWDYQAKTQRLKIARNSELRGEESIDELRKLIAADELPKAEINLSLASQNDRRVSRIAAEQAQLESRRTLGRLLGLSAIDTMAIRELADELPEYNNMSIDSLVSLREAIIARAMIARTDLLTLKIRQNAAEILLDAAKKNARPQLDFVFGVAQSGLAEGSPRGSLGPAFGQNYGPGYSGTLIYQMPLGNNAALGSIQQQAALVNSQRIRINELGHSIGNSIETSTFAMIRAVDQLKEAEAAAKTYAAGLSNERTKRRLGLSTLIDVLSVEERYNNALIASVQARQAYASAIAQFRFEASMLITRDGNSYNARVSDLFNPDILFVK